MTTTRRSHGWPQNNRNGGTRRMSKLRAKVLAAQPLCQLQLKGCTIRASQIDHIVPLARAPELRYVESNCRASCWHCNNMRNKIAGAKKLLENSQPGPPKPSAALAFFNTGVRQ
jgi:5-methylcytosine-specific restriction endonuclease McrA